MASFDEIDLEDWLTTQKLSGIKDVLMEVSGVESMEDLCTIVYPDAELMQEIKNHKDVSPVLFRKFVRAAGGIPGFAEAGHTVADPSAPAGTPPPIAVPVSTSPPVTAIASTLNSDSGSKNSSEVNSSPPVSLAPTPIPDGPSTALRDMQRQVEAEKRRQEAEERRLAKEAEEMSRLKAEMDALKIASKVQDSRVAAAGLKAKMFANKSKTIMARHQAIKKMVNNLRETVSLDLAFLVDCTCSMGPYLNAIKVNIINFARQIRSMHGEMSFRLAFVGYRDHYEDSKRLAVFHFNSDEAAFERFVAEQKEGNGHDYPEDVLGGMNMVDRLDWQSAVRVLYHIGDAPCHGKRFHEGLRDDYPDGDPNGLKPETILPSLVSKNILYFFGRLTKYTDKMIAEFNKILRSGGRQIDNCIETNDCSDPSSMMSTVSSSVSKSYSASVSSSSSTAAKLDTSHVIVDKADPTWSDVTIEAVEAYTIKLPSSMTALKEMEDYDFIHEVEHRQTLYLKVAPKPFDKGSVRRAHKALEFPEKNSSMAKRPLITKYSMKKKADDLVRRKYQESLSNQVAAIYLAQEFNKVKPRGYPEIHFAGVWLINHLERGAEGNPWGTMEEVLEGRWEKYNNNNGMVALLPGIPHEVCQAFSHWTWHVSRHDVMVVDIQGTYEPNRNRFFLTDPAIHCKDPSKFGSTNLAQEGMEQFFKSHVCNDCCRAMKLPPKIVK